MLKRMWNTEKGKIQKQSVFWNMMSSGLNSVVSMLLLFTVTRMNGVIDAGVFSLGFSTSQMMLTLGNYGMRNYQVTDVKNKYSAQVYFGSRIVTNVLMMLVVCAFVYIEGYGTYKAVITILLCVLKVTDAFDDIYGGYYQKNGRLDISGKIMTFRIFAYIIVFCLVLAFTHDLVFACVSSIVTSVLVLCALVLSTKSIFAIEKPQFPIKKIVGLLFECFPLCISAFLLIYIGNAPKYAIDAYLTNEAQAIYTYLFMPCFVTNLFVGFALQPLLVKMSKSWLHKQYKEFLKVCMLIFTGAVIISAVIIFFGGMWGCQILGIVFGIPLEGYEEVLIILLIGGAFFAFTVIEQIILTVMRKQMFLLFGFVASSVIAAIISKPLVNEFSLKGAGMAYSISAGGLFIVLTILIVFFLAKILKERKSTLD